MLNKLFNKNQAVSCPENCWWPKLLPVDIIYQYLSFGSDEIAVYNGMCNTSLWCFFGALLDFGHQQNQPLALGGTTNWADEIDAHDCFIQVQVSHAKKKPAVHSIINYTGCLIGILTEPQEMCWGFPSPSLSNQLQSMLTVVTSIKIESRCFFTKCMTSIHPGRLTAETYSHHPWKERNIIWNKPPWGHVPAVNLQGFTCCEHTPNDEPTFCEFHEGWSSESRWCLPCPKLPGPLLSDGLQCFFVAGSATFKCPREDFSTLETWISK